MGALFSALVVICYLRRSNGRLPLLLQSCRRNQRLALGSDGNAIEHSTMTLRVHKYPDDYYRFSPSVFRDVFFAGMAGVCIKSILTPPRLIGFGRRINPQGRT